MKIGPNLSSFAISAKGMSVQKKKMDIVAENIANASTTKTSSGEPYKRKFLLVEEGKQSGAKLINAGGGFGMDITSAGHIAGLGSGTDQLNYDGIETNVRQDSTVGELVYMPDHPDANGDGYVQMPNVDVVTEMIDMISATRNYEANLTAFNASKQIAKDSLEI
ncbi:MAG: flagellar basal body rod protein FlgC [Melioribacteraceae bacterium]|nr:MAG: flagellar basal body rod protein FlgC [Melioribacteraceae bacterium]